MDRDLTEISPRPYPSFGHHGVSWASVRRRAPMMNWLEQRVPRTINGDGFVVDRVV